jgi:LemA protein
LIAVIIIVGIIVLGVLIFVVMYNGLVKLRNRVESAWSQISVQLQRRHDLIPNLVETVKGYAAHERQTLEAVINARNTAVQVQQESTAGPAQQAQAENILSGALRQLFALSEAYPDLKANQNFLNLQEELTSTEDRISYARQFYNDQVQKYNTKIQSLPTNVIAGMFNFKEREFFEGDEAANAVPKVEF